MVSVRTVLNMAELGLTLRAGENALDRPISRIYGTELADPARFLSGGELVISGLLWLRAEADIGPFVAALARSGVAALIACDADTGVLPEALVGECARAGVPLLEGRPEESFAVIIDRVGLALAGERLAGGGRRLIAALAAGAELAQLLRLVAGEAGTACWVLTPLGRVVAAAGPPLASGRRAALAAAFLTGRNAPAGLTVLPVDDPAGPAPTRWFLVADGPVEPAGELVDLVGVYRARERERRTLGGQAVGTLLRAVAGGAPPGEITATARAAGVAVDRSLRVLAMTGPGAVELLAELVAALDGAGPVGVVGECAYAVLTATGESDADFGERAGAALRTAEPAAGPWRLATGISSAVPLARLRAAVQEAGHALEVAGGRGRSAAVVGAEVAVHRLLLAGAPEELRAELFRRVLGPVVDYDAEHDADLLASLRVFLDCSGSWSRAARRLHLHVNTLRYRIGRIEALTGADLGEFTDRMDLYLALLAGPG
ncbi:MAG TPA: helix-turn-helix domain-containing protein [Pseudonocardiaceae bacterium]|nr:helix-turn-helix domain-containing protein [Pseudonocardiaceae bacterium]